MVILQISAGALAVAFRDDLGDNLKTEMSTQVNQYVTRNNAVPITAAWNALQVEVRSSQNNLFDVNLIHKLTSAMVVVSPFVLFWELDRTKYSSFEI